MALPYAFRAFNGATRYSLLKPVVNASPPVPVQPSCSKATFDTHCSKRSSSCQTALSEEILYLLLFLTTFSILYIIITAKICQARISTNHAPDTFFLSEKSGCTSSAQPLFPSLYSRMPRHSCCEVRVMQLHDILLLRTSAILPEAISAGGLTPSRYTRSFSIFYHNFFLNELTSFFFKPLFCDFIVRTYLLYFCPKCFRMIHLFSVTQFVNYNII